MKKTSPTFAILAVFLLFTYQASGQSALVLQTDFGLKDGAVAEMTGVAYSVSPELRIFDLTHEIPPFSVWEAAYRLEQTAKYWPSGTVFVSVVDPGVGTDRKSVVLKTRSGHYFVTPDNGTLTFVAKSLGIAGLRRIDESRNRLPDSWQSHTFHGRDIYAYTGARLAAHKISFDQVGPALPWKVETIPHDEAKIEGGRIIGNIPIHDVNFGNVWTNIGSNLLESLGIKTGDRVRVRIVYESRTIYESQVEFVKTFGDVPEGKPLVYINSMGNVALAINLGSFAEEYEIGFGSQWRIEVWK